MQMKETIGQQVKGMLPSDETIYDLAEVFKVFGDSTRTKILSCLSLSNMRVGDIALACDMTLSAVSHQLRILKNAKLVRCSKVGKEVIYFLDDEHVEMIMESGLLHLEN